MDKTAAIARAIESIRSNNAKHVDELRDTAKRMMANISSRDAYSAAGIAIQAAEKEARAEGYEQATDRKSVV